MTHKVSVGFAVTGSAVLLATVALHMTGFAMVGPAAADMPEGSFLARALAPMWLMPALHWSILAVLAAIAAFHTSALRPVVLGGVALLLAADAGLMFWFLGPFIGEATLAAAALLFAVSAMLHPRQG